MTAALVSLLILVLARVLQTTGGLFSKSISAHDLEMEAMDSGLLLSRLLRGANPSSILLTSSPEGPWSHLRFASGPHSYEFYGASGQLLFMADEMTPKTMSTHLTSLQFSFERAALPTLLTWSIRLGKSPGSLTSAQASLSGTQFLDLPAE